MLVLDKMRNSNCWIQAAFALYSLLAPISAQDFDPREATIASVHNALHSGDTCRNIVSAFISRIEALNHHTNAIISLDPDSLTIASQHDAQFAAQDTTMGSLFCVPILIKDNIDVASVPTTGGSLALVDSRPTVDAAIIRALRDAGAIILGKTNLQEMALEGITVSSLGGQTINPYDSSRTPGGSSGGSGAAVAASFSVLAIGSDTMNSLRSPASANSLFTLRPTRGLVSRAGAFPVSFTQDSLGPICRSVEDIAITLTAIASSEPDPDDNSTVLVPEGIHKTDYSKGLDTASLEGKRIGVIENFFDRTEAKETQPVNDVMDAVMEDLKGAGAILIPINDDKFDVKAILSQCDTQRHEMRHEIDNYLSRSSLGGQHPTSLNELYSGQYPYLILPPQYDFIRTALVSSTENVTTGSNLGYEDVKKNIESLKSHLHKAFATERLDAMVFPHQRNLVVELGSMSQHGRSGILAAVTGFPSMAIPGGFSPATKSAPIGVPVGVELLGLPWTEGKLLQIAYQMQKLGSVRKSPVWARDSIPVKAYDAVPTITPDRSNIPSAYQLSRLRVLD